MVSTRTSVWTWTFHLSLSSLAKPLKNLAKILVCLLFLAAFLILTGATNAPCREIHDPKVAILVSQDIRPYIEAVEGLNAALAKAVKARLEVFHLEKFKGNERADLAQRLANEKFDLFVAIGPDAARFVWSKISSERPHRIFSMVLNPENVIGHAADAAGISLNIPAQAQLEIIKAVLPDIKSIGILYDPDHNSDFFREAAIDARSMDLKIIPLDVSSKKEIPIVLKQHWKDMDALWLIPDRTVISETIVQYVIKNALFEKVPVIGFNRFFYESGAALAFVFDYKELGEQCAREAIKMLSGETLNKTPPVFRTWVNARVMRNLGIELREEYPPPIILGP